jgi:hypothetical protein
MIEKISVNLPRHQIAAGTRLINNSHALLDLLTSTESLEILPQDDHFTKIVKAVIVRAIEDNDPVAQHYILDRVLVRSQQVEIKEHLLSKPRPTLEELEKKKEDNGW